MAKFEVIKGGIPEVNVASIESVEERYGYTSHLSPEQLYKLGSRATDELDSLDAYLRTQEPEEIQDLRLIQGEL